MLTHWLNAAQPILHPFTGSEGVGATPFAPNISLLAQGRDGNLYGTAPRGGLNSSGTAFRINSSNGAYTKLDDFSGAVEGSNAIGGLTLGNDGNFYGTSFDGGTNNRGTIFRVPPNKPIIQPLEVLHTFAWSPTNLKDGSTPYSSPVQGRDGNLYGTTYAGGKLNVGTVYKIAPNGTGFQVIYDFGQKVNNPDNPALPLVTANPKTSLILGKDGNFYGTTTDDCCNISSNGGTSNDTGTIFRISLSGALTVLHVFHFVDGSHDIGPLIQGTDGNLYGTAPAGGVGAVRGGTVFKLTLPRNKLTILHEFQFSSVGGSTPIAGLVQTGDGTLYGVAANGGISNRGVFFKITTAGAYIPVFDFANATPFVVTPKSTPMLHTNGKIYGMYNGGIYSFDVGAPAFVRPIPEAAKVGATGIGLLGNFVNFTSASFNGVNVSLGGPTGTLNTFRTTTVPAAPATGLIKVVKTTGTLSSLKPFYVLPTFTGFSPASGTVGTSVILAGTGLSQVTTVRFGGNKTVSLSLISVDNDSQLTVNVPIGALTGKITITTKGGSVASATAFTVLP